MYNDEIIELNNIWHTLIGKLQSRLTDEEFKAVGELSTTEISILRVLDTTPDVILKDICKRLNMPKSTLTSAVNRLVNKGYVERVSVNSDKRAFSLNITAEGSFVQKKHLEFEHFILSGLISGLSQEEILTLLDILRKTTGGIENE